MNSIEAPAHGIPYAVYMPSISSPDALYCPTTADNPKSIELAFPKKIRDWWMAVGNMECQTFVYDDQAGWHICGKTAQEVDHIQPEAWLLVQGIEDPNNTVGIPRCKSHHTGTGMVNGQLADYGSQNWSRHPDMGQARAEYHPTDNPNSFHEAAIKHRSLAKQGIRFWNSTPEIDEMERQHMEQLAYEYTLKHPNDPKPDYKPHKDFQKKHWWDFF